MIKQQIVQGYLKSKFLNIIGFIGILVFVVSCEKTQDIIHKTEFALGTVLTIKVFEGGSVQDVKNVFSEIKKIEGLMSSSITDYDNTEILDINDLSMMRDKNDVQQKYEYKVSPYTKDVLQKSLEIAHITNGAFDPTIGLLVSLWGFGTGSFYVPNKQEITNVLKRVNWNGLSVSQENKIELLSGQVLDVGGIAKGYTSDVAAKMLEDAGVTRAIIDFGGNIRTIGSTKVDGSQWKIGLQDPYKKMGSIIGFVKIGENSVITSGVYERFFEQDGKKYFHILDSTTGYPARNGLLSVSVIKKSGVEADGLSTGVFVLGLEKGLALIERLLDTEAVFVTDTNEVFISSGLIDNFEITSKNYKIGIAPQK